LYLAEGVLAEVPPDAVAPRSAQEAGLKTERVAAKAVAVVRVIDAARGSKRLLRTAGVLRSMRLTGCRPGEVVLPARAGPGAAVPHIRTMMGPAGRPQRTPG
jgi:hypothetical protein